jgi:hypothetical protein
MTRTCWVARSRGVATLGSGVQISNLAGESTDASGNERTPNLKFARPTPLFRLQQVLNAQHLAVRLVGRFQDSFVLPWSTSSNISK